MATTRIPFRIKASTPCFWMSPGMRQGIAAVLLGVALIHLALGSRAAAQSADRYAEARREIGEDLYPTYRILERLMQVNPIATPMAITLGSTTPAYCQPTAVNPAPCPTGTPLPSGLPKDATLAWAVQLIAANNSLGSSQKFSNGGYLLRMDKTTVDNLALKPTQLACVIAQELAHATLDHPQKFRTRSLELDGQTASLITAAVNNAHTAQRNRDTWLTIAIGLSAVGSGLSAAGGSPNQSNQAAIDNQFRAFAMLADAKAGGQVFQTYITTYYPILRTNAPLSLAAIAGMEGLSNNFVKRTQKDIDLYLVDYRKQLETSQQQLLREADARSVEFVARASINSQACLETLSSDLPPDAQAGPTADSTPAAPAERRKALQAAINALPATLQNADKKLLVPYLPLAYWLDRNTNTVSVFPTDTVPKRQTARDKTRSVESLLGR
jgi:hypothetical protein